MRSLLALVLVAGCSPTTFTFTPAARGVTPLAANCPVEVVTSVPPEKNYEEIGTLELYSGSEPKTLDAFKAAVKSQVCDAGGNGAIAVANNKGEYTQGTVIRYLPGTSRPMPVGKPIKEPPTQAKDTEKPPGT